LLKVNSEQSVDVFRKAFQFLCKTVNLKKNLQDKETADYSEFRRFDLSALTAKSAGGVAPLAPTEKI
jgi:hypothetical protein